MPRCIRCGDDTLILRKRICESCLKKWLDMRTSAYNTLVGIYGNLNPENHEKFKIEMRKLERTWKKNPEEFETQLQRIHEKSSTN